MEATNEIKAENTAVKESEITELKGKLDEANKVIESMKEAKRQETIEAYKKLCESKKVPAMDVSNMTIETVKALMDTVASIPEAKVETKEVAQVKSVEPKVTEKAKDEFDGYVWESSTLGGLSFYKLY